MPNEAMIARAVPGALIVQPNPIRAYLPPSFWKRDADFFVYSVEYNPLTASVATTDTFQTQNDSDFLCLGIAAIETTAVAGTTEQTFWPVTVRIFDTGSGAQWFDAAQQLHNVVGRGSVDGLGYRPLPYPRFIQGASEVSVECTNLEGTNRRLWIAFHGCKIFYRSGRL